MTHFNQAIRFLQNTKPKSKRDREAKRKALRILYNAEAKEKPNTRRKSVKRTNRKSNSSSRGFLGFLVKSGSKAINERIEKKHSYAEQKKRTIEAINASPNLDSFDKHLKIARINQKRNFERYAKSQLVADEKGILQSNSNPTIKERAEVFHKPLIPQDTPKTDSRTTTHSVSTKKPSPFGGFKSAETSNTTEGV